MASNVKSFSVEYNPINESNIFSKGDYITGQIKLELTKESKIESLLVKLKGKAKVKWTENYGRTVVIYQSKDKYFKQFIIQEGQGTNIISKGCHVFPFTFQIPAENLPSSFKGSFGKIAYTLEANLSRSMRKDSKAKTKFTLLHKENVYGDLTLKSPQQSILEKKMNLFTSGEVTMDVNIPQTGFYQGEGIKVVASISNKSSRDVTPKYCLYKKNSYFAKRKRKVETKAILKEVGEVIPPLAGQTVTRTITIPATTDVSVLNCKIIKAEYRLKVYLDVKYAVDPKIKFNIVILPALEGYDKEQLGIFYGSEAFSNSIMSGGTSFLQNPTAPDASAPSAPYMTYGMYPSLSALNGKS